MRFELAEQLGNYSLCHGLTGNVEVLQRGAAVLGSGVVDDESLQDDVAMTGVVRYADAGAPWPCGNHNEETPNLMLGLSGIGLFYLRMFDPAVRSIVQLDLSCS